jgi:uncharacterized protein involved in exopolysaccharide biosynthesis
MMDQEPPRTDQLPATSSYQLPGADIAKRNLLRLRIFSLTFLAVAAVGLVYTFTQPVSYQSHAVLLASGPVSGDEALSLRNAQEIARQQHLLFSHDLMAKTGQRLVSSGFGNQGPVTLRGMLDVQVDAGSSRVTITARGNDADLLPRIVNSWIDVYQEELAAEAEAAATVEPQATDKPLPDELVLLDRELALAKSELETFDASNMPGLQTLDKNELKSRRRELERAVSTAAKQEEKTRAVLLDIQDDIARGKTVIPRGELREIAKLERRLETQENKLADLDARYTRAFLELDPNLRDLPEEIEELRAEIERLTEEGNRNVMLEARDEYRDAQRVHASAGSEFNAFKQRDVDSASLSAQRSTLLQALEDLEKQRRDTTARLATTGSLPAAEMPRLPQLRVESRAGDSEVLDGGDTTSNAIIALAAALVAALFATWLYGFLNPAHAFDAAGLVAATEGTDEPQLSLSFQATQNQPPPEDPERE